jgi:hypothetical protein
MTSWQRRPGRSAVTETGTAAALATAALAAALAGCGGKRAPETAPRGPAPCERVGDHLVGLLTKGFEGPAEERPTEAIDKLTRVLVELCTRGGWSADAQQCFLTVGPPAEDVATWDRCAGYLTVEQRDELPRAIDAAFGKQGAGAAGG